MAAPLTRIIVTRRLPSAVLAPLFARPSTQIFYHDSDEPLPPATLAEQMKLGANAVICLLSDSISRSMIESTEKNLKVISTMSVGYSHIDFSACRDHGVRVGYTPGVLTEATADLVLALTLSVCRRLPEAAQAVKTGAWTSWKPFWMCGKDLANAHVGILGMGRIGEAVARRLRGFGCKIVYAGKSGAKPSVDAELGTRCVEKQELFTTCDVIITICALTPETRGMLDYAAFKSMKEDAIFINASRGEVVDQDALFRILSERPKMRAGLDVTSPEPLPLASPLLTLSNCLILPHIGSASETCRTTMAELTIANTLAALDGKEMPAEVV